MQHSNIKTLEYPSNGFLESVESLCQQGSEFDVVVPKNSKKKEILLKKLPLIIGEFGAKEDSILSELVRSYRIMEFYRACGSAMLDHGYVMTYEDVGELIVHFQKCPGTP